MQHHTQKTWHSTCTPERAQTTAQLCPRQILLACVLLMLATSKTSSEFDSDESKRLMDSWKSLKEKC